MDAKEKIAPIYSELQGYLSQAPAQSEEYIYAIGVWERYDETITELNVVSGGNYDGYRVATTTKPNTNYRRIATLDYCTKLGGLIARLHRKYFSEEPTPFSGIPGTIINQSQHQSQSVQMLLEVQEKIQGMLHKASNDSKEKTFLERVKNSLFSVRSAIELLALIMKTGKEVGLSVDELMKLFP